MLYVHSHCTILLWLQTANPRLGQERGGGEDATTVNPRQQSQQSTPQRFKKIYFVNALTL